jgi:hypothetical protein
VAVAHGIVADLVDLAVPIDSVTPHPENPNQGSVASIRAQLQEWGQHTPIVVQASTRTILAGHHTWQAARELGWTDIAASVCDYDDDEALEVLLGDNRPGRLARTDDHSLARILARSVDRGTLPRTGYNLEEFAAILRRTGRPQEGLEAEGDPPDPRSLWPTVRVEVAHDVYAAWTQLVRGSGATEDEVLADLIVRAGGR